MTGPRPYVLPLLVAGLGLAVGLGVGAGPVAEDTAAVHAARTDRLQDRIERLSGRVADLQAQGAADSTVLDALAAPLTKARLDGRTVVVVATPGAAPHDVRRVRTGLEGAGATVTGVLRLTGTYVDPARAQSPLEDLALRLVPPGVDFPDGATAIGRVGTVLARSTVRAPSDDDTDDDTADDEPPAPAFAQPAEETDQDAAEVIAGLDELEALTLDGDPGRLAELAVMVAGADRSEAEPALLGLLAALDAGGAGAVLAAPGDAAAGPVRWVRDSDDDGLTGVSTMDTLDGRSGPAVLALVLAEQWDGARGDYGLGRNAGRVLPDVEPGG